MSDMVYNFQKGCYVPADQVVAREHRSGNSNTELFGIDPFFEEYNPWGDRAPSVAGMVYDFGFGGFIPAGQIVASESSKNDGLRKVFDEAFAKVVFNKQLCTRIMHYVSGIFTREGNVEWFGSNLLGVHTIRFYDSDRNALFDQVLLVDEDLLSEMIKDSKTVDTSWAVAGDTFNLTIAYLVHRLMPKMSDKDFFRAAVEAVKVLQFKFYSSIYYHFFPKPVDMPAAEATYSQLSLKFDIRRGGNWGSHIEDRAIQFVTKESPHYDQIKRFDNPDMLIRFITDLNTRTKQTVKDYYAVLDKVRRDNSRVVTQTSRIELDGESIIRDKVTAFNTAKQNLLDASYSANNFYKERLARAVLEMVPKASPNALKTILLYIAQLPLGPKRDEVNSIMEDALSHAFDLISSNRINFKDVPYLLNRMRALYQASKSTNEYVMSLRKRIEKLAAKETHLTHDSALAAVRNALLLYFLIRSIDI